MDDYKRSYVIGDSDDDDDEYQGFALFEGNEGIYELHLLCTCKQLVER